MLSGIDAYLRHRRLPYPHRRLWARWHEIDTNLDAYAALRSSETAVVVLEPIPGTPGTSWGT